MTTTFISRPPHQSRTLSARIVDDVRADVFEGRLKPGDVLGAEHELAARYGVSRITVRDALRSLSATGIVEIRQGAGGGARIAQANLVHFAEALALQFQLAGVTVDETLGAQFAIEGTAAELAALHRTESDLEEMRVALVRAEAVMHDAAEFTEASLGFHLAVAEASHNRALVALLRAVRDVVWPRTNASTTPDIAAHVQKKHRAIYERIEARDGDGARDAMTAHLGGIQAWKHRQRARATC